MRGRIKPQELIGVLLCAAFVSTIIAKDVLSSPLHYSPFYSPRPPTPDGLVWIYPSDGGRFTNPNCPGIEVSFPKDFLGERVNVHCGQAQVKMQLGPGLVDVGQRFFFGTWSGFGEATKFQNPLSFQVSYQEERDGQRVIPEGMEATLSLYLWDEKNGIWRPLYSKVDEDANYVIATVDTLLPTRHIQGWDGNSLMALLMQIPEITPAYTPAIPPTPTPSLTSTPMPISSSPTETPTAAIALAAPYASGGSLSLSPTETPTAASVSLSLSATETPAASSVTPITTSVPTFTSSPLTLASPTPTQTPKAPLVCGAPLSSGLLLGLSIAILLTRARRPPT
jgi:hypothetical protein